MIWYGLQVISYRRFHVTVLPTRHQKMALFIREMPGIRCLNEIKRKSSGIQDDIRSDDRERGEEHLVLLNFVLTCYILFSLFCW